MTSNLTINAVIAAALGLIAIAAIIFLRDQAMTIATPIIAALLTAWNPNPVGRSNPTPTIEKPQIAERKE